MRVIIVVRHGPTWDTIDGVYEDDAPGWAKAREQLERLEIAEDVGEYVAIERYAVGQDIQ